MGLNKYFGNIRKAPKCIHTCKDFPKKDTIDPGFEDELGIQQEQGKEMTAYVREGEVK